MKLLYICSRFPWPLEKGDKVRSYHQIRELSKKHDVYLFALNETAVTKADLEQLRPFCREIKVVSLPRIQVMKNLARAFFSGLPLQVGYFYSPAAKKSLQSFFADVKPDAVFCQLIRMAEFVRHNKQVPKLLDYMDAFGKGMQRLARTKSTIFNWPYHMECRRLLKYEQQVFDDFKAHTIISQQDKLHINHPQNSEIAVVPNGVDVDFWYPQKSSQKKYELLFAGNMNYPPNIESVQFIVREIMPLVWQQNPQAKLLIAGANPAPAVKQLQEQRVVVTGWIDDIRVAFAESKILLAPMLISIGQQNKILQGMAMEMPCVVSELANNAIAAEDGRHLIVAKEPQQYADQILELLGSEEKSAEIGRNARAFVQERYTWQRANAQIEELLGKMVKGKR